MPEQWTMIGLHTPTLEVRDHHGRRYRVGEQPRELTGRSRAAMLWACWLPMLLVGTMQYAFGAAMPGLLAAGHELPVLCWTLAGWTVLQAGAGFPAALLRRHGRVGPRTLLVVGGALCALGITSLGHGVTTGYWLLGGTGAGLVYAACTSTAEKWFPEGSAARVGVVTGAFAYGATPFVLALSLAPGHVEAGLTAFAPVLLVAVAGCALVVADPPRHWWPAHVDHRDWARSNPPAAREFSATEALRTAALPVMAACLFCAAAVSLFDAAFLALLAAPLSPVAAIAVFVATNGAGRAVAIPVTRKLGRRRTLRWVVTVQAVGQLLLLAGIAQASAGWLLAGATVAGIGGGAFYPLFAALARECFGQRRSTEVHGLVYSAKAVSGVVGIGLGWAALATWGPSVALGLSAVLSLTSAVLCGRLRRPGFPRTLPTGRP
ncbi:MFS transporter [Saccharopolyspora rhizosphaerae]|uniref:MFS transporter n=1 Tax=Saccharopolyspora rhizosphaerae TaxID=2492662 RepID=A0A3R8R864_9PSEU|nr:MFS transporter [Saccharopolyspora rhizosphaerae]RRO20608.1 MFS transporter [Saccharopolyspora rhizosphaerae]